MSVHVDPVLVTLHHRFGHLRYDSNPTMDPEIIHDLINRLCKQDRNVDMILSERSIQFIKNETDSDSKNEIRLRDRPGRKFYWDRDATGIPRQSKFFT
uniref:Uncharacterized protein n=1 Tax=Romanomermis culicivorax TaxID=13658 RepID=A0A915KVW0_ROMCU